MEKRLITLALLLLLMPLQAQAATYYVGPGETYTTYAAWAAAVTEQDGDIVYFQRGATYTEIVNVYVNLDLRAYGTGARPVIDAVGLSYGAIIWGAKTVKITGIEVKGANGGLLAVQSGQLGVWQVDDCYIHDNVANPCITGSGDGGFVKNSIVDNCANCAWYGINASNWLIENNTMSDSVTNDIVVCHDGIGSGIIVRGNLLSGAPENAVDIQSGYSGTIVENNIIEHTALYPIGNGGTGTIIRENVIRDCARGIYTSQPAEIYNNFFKNLSDDSYGTLGGSGGVYFTADADGSEVYNCTFVEGAQATGRPMLAFDSGADSIALKNNVYWQQKAQSIYYFTAAPVGLVSDYNRFFTVHTRIGSAGATVYSNFAAWQATGQDTNSTYGDPLLSSTGKPTGNSPEFIKSGGDMFDGVLGNYDGRTAPVGAFGWGEGTMMPPSMFYLSSPAGALALGRGKVYNADTIPDYSLMDGTFYLVDGTKYITNQ